MSSNSVPNYIYKILVAKKLFHTFEKKNSFSGKKILKNHKKKFSFATIKFYDLHVSKLCPLTVCQILFIKS